MRAATIQEIKQELATVKPAQLMSLCLRLAKFKKENKELLTYLLFEAGDEAGYLRLHKSRNRNTVYHHQYQQCLLYKKKACAKW